MATKGSILRAKVKLFQARNELRTMEKHFHRAQKAYEKAVAKVKELENATVSEELART